MGSKYDMASTLDELLQRLDYLPALTRDAETALITKAYNFAERAHSGQLRKSGEPYFTHPVGVAGIIADMSFFVIFMFLFFLGFIAEMKLDAASLSFFVLFYFFLGFFRHYRRNEAGHSLCHHRPPA
jgi:(p)ppGpp synthase/HD superfamily hydrolase